MTNSFINSRRFYFQALALIFWLLLTNSHSASAANYTWSVINPRIGYGPIVQGFTSPIEACKQAAIVETNLSQAQDTTPAVYTFISAAFYNDFNWQCTINIKRNTENTNKIYYAGKTGSMCKPGTTTNPATGVCNDDEQKGLPQEKACSVTGNPINFAIGNKFQTESDYLLGRRATLSLIRNYNSLDGLWRHNFSTHLRFASTQYVSLARHDGRESFFTISGATVTPTSSDLGMLTKTGTTGWHYVSADNEHFTFDTAGKLTQWSNTQGQSYQLAYSGSQITATDNLGNSLTLTEDADHQPLSLTAPGVQITYTYNANNRLTSVNRTAGGQTTQRQYHYEVAGKPNLLTGITDERGIRYATWAYDDQGRAISSEHADGADKVTVAYNSDGTVSVTNELGKVAKYSFQYIKGVKRITAIDGEPSPNCPSSNSTFTYDDRGLLKTKTDNKGNLTTYTYNARGLEISRTEASGTAQARTITTDWHPTLFLPTVVTDPKRITTYHYDHQGRQLSNTVEER